LQGALSLYSIFTILNMLFLNCLRDIFTCLFVIMSTKIFKIVPLNDIYLHVTQNAMHEARVFNKLTMRCTGFKSRNSLYNNACQSWHTPTLVVDRPTKSTRINGTDAHINKRPAVGILLLGEPATHSPIRMHTQSFGANDGAVRDTQSLSHSTSSSKRHHGRP